jgi:hypothetical protein
MSNKKMTDNDFAALFDAANAAGRAAAMSCDKMMMQVVDADIWGNPIPGAVPYAPCPICGFAWVIVKPGTSSFARWLKKSGHGRKDDYYGGICVSIFDYNQSYAMKSAHAGAMAKTFRDAGFTNCWSMDRLD